MGNFMSTDIAPLGESLLADVTGVWLFAGVASFMGLYGRVSMLVPEPGRGFRGSQP